MDFCAKKKALANIEIKNTLNPLGDFQFNSSEYGVKVDNFDSLGGSLKSKFNRGSGIIFAVACSNYE